MKERSGDERTKTGDGAALHAAPGSEGDTTAKVMGALRGEIPPEPWMVDFVEHAAMDAEAYGDFPLGMENRMEADKLRRMISQNVKDTHAS